MILALAEAVRNIKTVMDSKKKNPGLLKYRDFLFHNLLGKELYFLSCSGISFSNESWLVFAQSTISFF